MNALTVLPAVCLLALCLAVVVSSWADDADLRRLERRHREREALGRCHQRAHEACRGGSRCDRATPPASPQASAARRSPRRGSQ